MEIVSIHKPYLYSIKFDEEELDEYNRLLEQWAEVDVVKEFFDKNKDVFDSFLSEYFHSTFEAAEQVADEAETMESYFEELSENCAEGYSPNFDDYFKFLDGIYNCEIKYIPMKGYGEGYRPSIIRFYAIKIEANVYVIATGGIKMARTIQDSPGLGDTVFRKIDKTRKFLSSLGITEAGDIS